MKHFSWMGVGEKKVGCSIYFCGGDSAFGILGNFLSESKVSFMEAERSMGWPGERLKKGRWMVFAFTRWRTTVSSLWFPKRMHVQVCKVSASKRRLWGTDRHWKAPRETGTTQQPPSMPPLFPTLQFPIHLLAFVTPSGSAPSLHFLIPGTSPKIPVDVLTLLLWGEGGYDRAWFLQHGSN